MEGLQSSRLYRLAQKRPAVAPVRTAHVERCELCSQVVPSDHRHLLDTQNRKFVCACRACSTLFDNGTAGGRHYRLIPADVFTLPAFSLSDGFWQDLAIPVDLAFFFFDTAAGRVVALYPGPMGVAETELSLDTWRELAAANPVIRALTPDVQALLVNRTRGARESWLVPIDLCYSLVGLIRLHWKGLGGGEEVWIQLDKFFSEVRERASVLPGDVRERASVLPSGAIP